MKKGKFSRTRMSLMVTALLFVASAVIAYGQGGAGRRDDQCAEHLASYNRLNAQVDEITDRNRDRELSEREMGSLSDQYKQIWSQMGKVIRSMRALGCPNTPDVPISGSGSDQPRGQRDATDVPTTVPESEGAAEYTVLPEPRYLSLDAFIAKVQPPEHEAEGSCGDLSGRWRITTSEGSQTWEIWKTDIPRVYGGRKLSGHGGHSKMLSALLEGNMLRFQFDTYTEQDEVFGGTYNCKLSAGCQSSLSPCKLNYDRNRRGSFDATFKWLGPLQRQ